MNLKPCPFCGSPGKMRYYDPGIDRAPSRYFVSCTGLLCPVAGRYAETSTWSSDKGHTAVPGAEQQAAEFWNRRAANGS